MSSKYPIVLVHGIAAKQLRILNAFGQIGRELEKEGYIYSVAGKGSFAAPREEDTARKGELMEKAREIVSELRYLGATREELAALLEGEEEK